MNPVAIFLACLLSTCTPSGPAFAAVASWYGNENHQNTTATGEHYNPNGLTAAHRTLPFGTMVRVTHDNRSVVVRINDRGPFVRGRDIDLSHGAAAAIGCLSVCQVQLEVLR